MAPLVFPTCELSSRTNSTSASPRSSQLSNRRTSTCRSYTGQRISIRVAVLIELMLLDPGRNNRRSITWRPLSFSKRISRIPLRVCSALRRSSADVTTCRSRAITRESLSNCHMFLSMLSGTYRNRAIVSSSDRGALFEIAVVIDPATELAQRWAPIIETLAALDTVHLRVYLNPTFGLSDLPIKRFYQYSFPRALEFDDVTGRELQPSVRFEGIPEDTLLTFAIDAHQSWLAFPRSSVHDLDNIRLEDLSESARLTGIEAVLELESLVVEGHAREMPSSKPPRGLQLELSKSSADSSVAAKVE